MNINAFVLNYLIDKAKDRLHRYGHNFTKDCCESVEIFDELDALDKEELFVITQIYLLGDVSVSCANVMVIHDAKKQAQLLGFTAVDLMAFAPDLGERLERGCNIMTAQIQERPEDM